MKHERRKQVLAQRNSMPHAEWASNSEEICKLLLQSHAYQNANTIFTFVSFGKEVNTYPLIEQAWQDGKIVATPIAKKGKLMYFVPTSSFADLKKTAFGTLEADKDTSHEISPTANDLFLVPGAVFDQNGNRYGYGGGFYDQYLEKFPEIKKIAVAFSFQLQNEPLQVETYDIPVDTIITEKGIWEVKK